MSTLFFTTLSNFKKKYKVQGIRKKEKEKEKGEKRGGGQNYGVLYKQGKRKY